MKKLLPTSCPKPAKRPKSERIPLKKSRVNPVNRARKRREFERAYGSSERVDFVRGLPCVVTGKSPCENAHIVSGGMGRKADYRLIVPLIPEKHKELHDIGAATFCRKYWNLNLEELAAEVERAWQDHLSQTEKRKSA